ncbi:MAG: acyltransferase [Succinivibrionaceae bacterium]|nr:acyltransferase [Succinivibrionaceae bacterium]
MPRTFTRDDTALIKGVAILLMVVHHCCTFYERTPLSSDEIESFRLSGFVHSLGGFGDICVSFFMFLAGYGLYCRFAENRLSLTRDLKRIYAMYWKVILVFIPIGFAFFSEVPAEYAGKAFNIRFEHFHIDRLLWNLTALRPDYNGEWWFITPYIFMLMYGYAYVRMQKSNNPVFDILSVSLVILLFQGGGLLFLLNSAGGAFAQDAIVRSLLCPEWRSSLFWVGLLCRKYELLDAMLSFLAGMNKIKRIIVSLVVVYACFRLRNSGGTGVLGECAIVVSLVAALTSFNRVPVLSAPVRLLGNQCGYIWLTHSFFCYYYFWISKNIVYSSGNTMVASLITLALSLLAAIMLGKFYGKAGAVLKPKG